MMFFGSLLETLTVSVLSNFLRVNKSIVNLNLMSLRTCICRVATKDFGPMKALYIRPPTQSLESLMGPGNHPNSPASRGPCVYGWKDTKVHLNRLKSKYMTKDSEAKLLYVAANNVITVI